MLRQTKHLSLNNNPEDENQNTPPSYSYEKVLGVQDDL